MAIKKGNFIVTFGDCRCAVMGHYMLDDGSAAEVNILKEDPYSLRGICFVDNALMCVCTGRTLASIHTNHREHYAEQTGWFLNQSISLITQDARSGSLITLRWYGHDSCRGLLDVWHVERPGQHTICTKQDEKNIIRGGATRAAKNLSCLACDVTNKIVCIAVDNRIVVFRENEEGVYVEHITEDLSLHIHEKIVFLYWDDTDKTKIGQLLVVTNQRVLRCNTLPDKDIVWASVTSARCKTVKGRIALFEGLGSSSSSSSSSTI